MLTNTNNSIEKIPIKTYDGIVFKNPDDIIWMDTDSRHTFIYLVNTKEPLRSISSIAVFKNNLFPGFFICNRAQIINLKHVDKLEKDHRTVHLTNDHEVIITETHIDAFLKITRASMLKRN